jgi:hypothetical protein
VKSALVGQPDRFDARVFAIDLVEAVPRILAPEGYDPGLSVAFASGTLAQVV